MYIRFCDAAATMTSIETFREFISDRLSAAAVEIFTVFERTIVQYEEQIDRQRRLLDITEKPHVESHGAANPHRLVCTDEQFCNQETKSSLDQESPEPSQCQKEPKELWVIQVEQQSDLEESDAFVETPDDGESDHSEADSEKLLSHKSVRMFVNLQLSAAAGEILFMLEQTMIQNLDLRAHGAEHPQQHVCTEEQETNSTVDHQNPEPPQWKEEQEELAISQPELKQAAVTMETADGEGDHSEADSEELLSHNPSDQLTAAEHKKPPDIIWKPLVKLHRIDCQQQHVCKEEQLCNQETTSDMCREEMAPPHIKEEQEELCTTLEEEQFYLKQETDDFMEAPAGAESDSNELQPDFVLHLFTESALAESQDQIHDQYVESGSSRIEEVRLESVHYDDESHNHNANNSPLMEHQSENEKGNQSLECEICGKSFKSLSIKKKHYKIHSGEKPYSCTECSKSFNRMCSLKIHRRTHTGERPYSCSECSKSFSQQSTLSTHMKTHSGEKPYFCPECNKSFNMQKNLMVHMRTHTGERPYTCPECSKSFRQLSSFVIHKRTHTGEKPYSCPECSRTFRHLSSFFTHKRTHTGEKPYSCSECSKSFSDHSHWKIHKRSHTGEKPYSCVKCNKSFALRRSFSNHMKKHLD